MNYTDVQGRGNAVSPEALLALLRTLGGPVSADRLDDVPQALRERKQDLGRRRIEPVCVVWEGSATKVGLRLRLSEQEVETPILAHLHLEDGTSNRTSKEWSFRPNRLPTGKRQRWEGVTYYEKEFKLPVRLPLGYHRLALELPGRTAETLLISAPRQAFSPPDTENRRTWGVFLPLYAAHSQRSWGSGDFSDLEAISKWVADGGGNLVGTLPLLPTFLDTPFDPSPYAPLSRRFWNEFYLDVQGSPEFESSAAAKSLWNTSELQRELKRLRKAPLVDYRRGMALKRKVLEAMAADFFKQQTGRHEDFRKFLKAKPDAESYARFRAVTDTLRKPWPRWPRPLRDGILQKSDFEPHAEAYHRFVQWQAHDQMRSVSQAVRRRGTHLYLDFPLGVHRHGYDVWRERESFALGASAGAPPDTFFPEGQDWGFPPFHPERIRREGYRSFIAALRHHLESASVLRLDHVMGLHRLFWIPQGATPRDGAYVDYRAEEFYAILALESQRRKALIIGEDLGTVPPTVRPAMRKHNIYRMFVLQYELRRDGKRALPPVPAHSLASLNTHDMSPFRAFWEALDVQDRLDLGLLDLKTAKKERASREALKKALVKFLRHSQRWESSKEVADTREVLRACLRHLFAGSRAPVMLNLEDLWLEPRPQNVPGTLDERPNWRRKARHSLEHIRKMPEIADLLRELNQLRS